MSVLRVAIVVWTLAFAFGIVGVVTKFEKVGGTSISMWEACNGDCTKLDSDSVDCNKQFSTIQALRAFGVAGTVIAFIVAVILVVALLERPFVVSRFSILFLMVLGIICLTLAWILEVVLFTTEYCGNDSAEDSDGKLITSFGFFVTASGLTLIFFFVYFCI